MTVFFVGSCYLPPATTDPPWHICWFFFGIRGHLQNLNTVQKMRVRISVVFYFSLGQWLNFKLFGITYLVGKISRSNFFFQGPLAEWDLEKQLHGWSWTEMTWIENTISPRVKLFFVFLSNGMGHGIFLGAGFVDASTVWNQGWFWIRELDPKLEHFRVGTPCVRSGSWMKQKAFWEVPIFPDGPNVW